MNEAVNQLADAYLERKQRESGRHIAPDDYLLEKQKVKAYLADNRVFGVDRNPVAIELAEVSLWLNTIYTGHTIPWFGGQLAVGDSLVGARRQVFFAEQLTSATREWLDAVPESVPAAEDRKNGRIWHFLVPDKGMADYKDKAVKQMLPDGNRYYPWELSLKGIQAHNSGYCNISRTRRVDLLGVLYFRNCPAIGNRMRKKSPIATQTTSRGELWLISPGRCPSANSRE
ncbi:MAG: hypothetical protein IID45_15895 [Planctomycetes bacterium]|nr:hypothetical protein [Planctomycetota bacterium]